MTLPSLHRELAIASQAEAEALVRERPGYWHVISIREPFHPEPVLDGALSVFPSIFEDVLNGQGQHGHGPRTAHLEGILKVASLRSRVPLLVHCWAGRSRSTAVALALIVKELWDSGEDGPRLVTAAVNRLLALRPLAVPNALVLRLALQLIVPPPLPLTLAQSLLNEPRLAANRAAFHFDPSDQDP